MNQKAAFLKFVCRFPECLLLLLLMTACAGPSVEQSDASGATKTKDDLRYAKRFAIRTTENYTLVSLFGNRNNYDTTCTFLLSADSTIKDKLTKNQIFIKFPCQRIAALSSIYSSMLCEVGAADQLVAIDNGDYVNNATIREKLNRSQLKELARTPEPDLEQSIRLRPDIVFMFGMGEAESKYSQQLRASGIPVAVVLDHLEDHPLGRAEWIRFFAAFSGHLQQADSLFNEVEQRYLLLKKQASGYSKRPTVFSEIKFGDVWYMPGGKSFMALLISDAGGNYLWSDVPQAGSLPLTLEQVVARASDADIWLNQPLIFSLESLKAADPRYGVFKALKTGKIFNNTKNRNAYGYSDYWETGMIHPERILSDLIQIFHGDSLIKSSLYYYEQLH